MASSDLCRNVVHALICNKPAWDGLEGSGYEYDCFPLSCIQGINDIIYKTYFYRRIVVIRQVF